MKNKGIILKRILACMMIVVMTVTAAPLSGFVGLELPGWLQMFSTKASAATSGYYTYTVSGSKATVTACSSSVGTTAVIPERLGLYQVTAIGSNAFSSCTNLTKVTIPASVTSIGSSAFSACSKLEYAYYPGTPGNWNQVSVASGNTYLSDALMYHTTHTNINRDGICDVCGLAASDITVGGTASVSVSAGQIVYLLFIPESTGTYTFKSSSSSDTYGYLYNEGKSELTHNDDGGTNNNFLISYSLTAGTKYYWGVKYYSSSTSGSFNVSLTSSHTHSYGSLTTVKNATCTRSGAKQRTCSGCGNVETQTISALGHSYSSSYTTDTAATCTANGSKSQHCTRSGCTAKTNVTTIAATGHTNTNFDGKCDVCNAETPDIALNETLSVPVSAGQKVYLMFIPSVSGSYTFTSDSSNDTYGYLYDRNKSVIKSDDDSGSGNNFLISHTLTAGTKYYWGVRFYSSSRSGTISVKLTHSHSYGSWATVTAATCTASGSQRRTCSICGNVETQTVSALGHSYSSTYTTDTAATCTTSGSKSQHCTRSGCTAKTNVTTIAATGHTNTNFDGKCDDCNAETPDIALNETVSVPVSAGQKVYLLFIPETTGTYTLTSSSSSDTYGYLYDSSKNQITYDDDSGSGNNFLISYTLTAGRKYYWGVKYYSSSNSGTINVKLTYTHNHSYGSWTTVTAATCTASGSQRRTCSSCGNVETQTISALGHSYTNSCDTSCNVCAATRSITHSYGSWSTTTAATCTASGSKRRTCSVCGNVETQTISALGHSYSSTYTIDTAATCTTNGSKSKHCTRSGCLAITNMTTIYATGHSYTNSCDTSCNVCGTTRSITHTYGSWSTTTAATCTASGSKRRTCSVCGNIETQTISALGHSYSSTYTTDTAATCTTNGSKSQHCTRSGCTAKTNVTTIYALGHSYSSTYTTDTAATCTTNGSKSQHCTRSGCTAKTNVTTIYALGHSYSSSYTTDTAATCTTSGSKSQHCTRSGCTAKTNVTTIAATGHTNTNFDGKCDVCNTETPDIALNETLSVPVSAGQKVYLLFIPETTGTYTFTSMSSLDTYGYLYDSSKNQITYNDDSGSGNNFLISYTLTAGRKYYWGVKYYSSSTSGTIDVKLTHSHSYGSWTTVTAATCTASGSQRRTCSSCGNVETQTISALGHSYTNSCDTSCNVCAATRSITHSYGSWSTTTAATCTASGSKRRTCSVCGNIETQTISALGHSYSSSYTTDTAATCTTSGSKSQHCTRSGCTAKTNVTTIYALGHSYSSTYTTDTAATCTTSGSKSQHCTRSGCTAKTNVTTISALGHSYSSSYTTDTAATCTTNGSKSQHCTRSGCTAKTNVTTISALGHSYSSSYTIDTAATCTANGSKSRHCIRSGCTAKTNVTTIAMTGHTNTNFDGKCDVCNTEMPDIALDETLSVPVSAGRTVYLLFIPETTGTYTFTSMSSLDTYGYLYDSSKNQITYNDDSGSGNNFLISYTLTAGRKYYWGVKYYSSSASGTIDVKLTHTHSYGSWTTVTAATCTTSGSQRRVCSACGSVEFQAISALGHSYTNSCDTSCNVCGATRSITHSYGSWSTTTQATCTTSGSKRRTCSVCGNIETQTISALGHNYSSSYTTDTAATCTTSGIKSQHCTRSGCTAQINVTTISALGHSYSSTYTIDAAATCTENGIKSQHCTRSGCTSKINATVIPKVEHTNTVLDGRCDVCGTEMPDIALDETLSVSVPVGQKVYLLFIPETTGTYTFTSLSPWDTYGYLYDSSKNQITYDDDSGDGTNFLISYTLTAGRKYYWGVKFYKSNTGGPISVRLTHTHTYGSWTTVTAATCTASGSQRRTCSTCGNVETQTVSALGHRMVYVDYVEETCTTAGCESHYKCTVCNKLFDDYYGEFEVSADELTIPANGHSWEIDFGYEPTCDERGLSDYEYCLDCGLVNQEAEVIPPLGHDYYLDDRESPTCTSAGYEEYLCLNCMNSKFVDLPALGHSYSTAWTVDKKATCTASGSKSHHCTRCSAKKDVTSIAALGHKTKTTVTPATTTQNGKTVSTCTVCKKQVSSQTVAYVKTVSLSKTVFYYNGKTVTPKVIVKDAKGKALKSGTDFTVTYPKSRKNPGTYSVKVTFKGNYTGSKTLKFKLQPGTVTGLKQIKRSGYQLAIQWKAVPNATWYEVQRYDSKTKKWISMGKADSTKIGFKKASGTYKWRIRAIIAVGSNSFYGDFSKTLTTKS